jgi:hypothetical protein
VHYFHIDSGENVSDCHTKHLPHPQLWALIKERLFHCWAECTVNALVMVPDGYAPGKEGQSRNSIGQEHVRQIGTDLWHLVFVGHFWMLPVMINRQLLVVPVFYGGSGVIDTGCGPLRPSAKFNDW